MKRLLIYIVLVVLGIALAGCGTAAQEIKMKSQSERTDVFGEVKEEVAIPKGFADLIIKASIKTHLEGYYIGESKESLHGKPEYPFLINIDGQAAIWKVTGAKETTPKYNKDGKTSRAPEAGEGMKYALDRKVRLRAGLHKVFFGLPEEKYSVEVEITFKEEESAVLEFKPIYRTKRIPTRIPTFLKGVDKYEVFLNGKAVGIPAERQGHEHPLVKAIVERAEKIGIRLQTATDFSAPIGVMSVAFAVFVHEASELLAVANGLRVARG